MARIGMCEALFQAESLVASSGDPFGPLSADILLVYASFGFLYHFTRIFVKKYTLSNEEIRESGPIIQASRVKSHWLTIHALRNAYQGFTVVIRTPYQTGITLAESEVHTQKTTERREMPISGLVRQTRRMWPSNVAILRSQSEYTMVNSVTCFSLAMKPSVSVRRPDQMLAKCSAALNTGKCKR
jgi:hypothetical protein